MKQSTYIVYAIILVFLPQFLLADVTPNNIFSNHMVIQRDTEIPIWGWADVNEKVKVEASWGAKAEVTTGPDGTWKVTLKTPNAGGPHQITITGKNTIVINDVLSGEVWLCTGQSNMDFAMAKFVNDAKEAEHQPLVEYIRREVKSANDDWIRHIEVPQTTSLNEKKPNFEGNWVSADSVGIEKISATGYFFAKELRRELNVPIGLVECSWGGTRIEPWISEKAYLEDENLKDFFEINRKEVEQTIAKMDAADYSDTVYLKKLAIWQKKGGKGRKPRATVHPKNDRQVATTLYNGMLYSIIPYKIKGAIWYQGESNAVYRPSAYEESLTAMINSWRADWGQGDFSFYWAQLAACNRGNDNADKGWATVNDKLRRTLKVPNTGMAVLYDIGEPKDIHPHNKMDVGKRLAFWVLDKDYNRKVKAVSGPLFKLFQVNKNKIEIEFSHTGSGLMVGHKYLLEETKKVNAPLKWFEIKGADGIWKPAKATIIANNKIEVWSAEVNKPIQVRYAWSGNPEGANLYNLEGLPASVFTTEE